MPPHDFCLPSPRASIVSSASRAIAIRRWRAVSGRPTHVLLVEVVLRRQVPERRLLRVMDGHRLDSAQKDVFGNLAAQSVESRDQHLPDVCRAFESSRSCYVSNLLYKILAFCAQAFAHVGGAGGGGRRQRERKGWTQCLSKWKDEIIRLLHSFGAKCKGCWAPSASRC